MIAPAGRRRDARGRFAAAPRSRPSRKRDAEPENVVRTMHITRGPGRSLEVAIGTGFDVTRSDRTRRSRTYTVGGADVHAEPRKLDKLREIGRDLDRNSCLMHGIVDRFVHNVLGDTFGFRPATDDEGWNRAAHEWMVEQNGPESDARGLFDWHDRMAVMLRALCTDGDSFMLHIRGGRLQTIEAHQVGTPSDKTADKSIVNGVKMTKAGRPLGIWVGDQRYSGFYPQTSQMRYVPTGQYLWPAYRTRYTQTRGIPMIAAALSHFDRLDEYIDNESLAAAVDACLAFFVQAPKMEYGELPDDTYTRDGTNGEDGTTTTEQLQQVQPGTIAYLGPDETVQQFGAKRPGTQFDPYITASIRILGAAMGQPLELVLLDFSKTNYSSARAALLQAYRVFKIWQQWLIRHVGTPIYRRWMGQAIAAGDLTPNAQAGKVRWFPPQWGWVDPAKEIIALREAIALGVTTATEEVNRRGRTMDEHVAERGAEIAAMSDASIPSTGMKGVTVPNGPNAYDAAFGVVQATPVEGGE